MEHLSASDIYSFKLYQSEEEPTGSAIIYASQGNGANMIAIYSGVNTTFTEKEISAIKDELEYSSVLLHAYIERYNRTVRYDWLGQHLFSSLNELQE